MTETRVETRESFDRQGAKRDVTVWRVHERGPGERIRRKLRGTTTLLWENVGQFVAGGTVSSGSEPFI